MESTYGTVHRLAELQRASGGFAMVALDQRESMRAMFAEHQHAPVTDGQLTEFKVAAGRILGPHASGVLVDKQFALDRFLDDNVGQGTALIAAADRLRARREEIVAEVALDESIDPVDCRERGVVAMKLLVLYRPDGDPGVRIGMVERFVERCRTAGLLSIIEPVSRPPMTTAADSWNWDDGILAAATELGHRGADLYKAEVPLHGVGAEAEMSRRCAALSGLIGSPWVVLSSGVPADAFPEAVRLACREGASGFLAGRAVWRSCIGRPDVEQALSDEAVPRLRHLASLVDDALG
jgi:sulfofructosephosphate aldolase